jgi:hypothetical protein
MPRSARAPATSCMVMPASEGALGQSTVFPSKKPMLVIAPSEMTPSGPVSRASSKPA